MLLEFNVIISHSMLLHVLKKGEFQCNCVVAMENNPLKFSNNNILTSQSMRLLDVKVCILCIFHYNYYKSWKYMLWCTIYNINILSLNVEVCKCRLWYSMYRDQYLGRFALKSFFINGTILNIA